MRQEVLVIEDFCSCRFAIKMGLKDKVKVLEAATLEEGKRVFQKNPDVSLVIMDACVPGDEPNSMPLIKKILSAGYSKPIIAISGNPEYRKILLRAGATHEAEKHKVAELALKLLNLM